MTAIEIKQFGGPEVLTPGQRPAPRPAAGEVLIEGRRGRGQSAGHAAAPGRLRAAAGRHRHSRAWRSPAGSSRSARASRAGRSATQSARWWPAAAMPSIARAPAPQCLPVPKGYDVVAGGGAARDLLHGLDQRVRSRPPASRARASSSMAARAASAPRRSSSAQRLRRARLHHRRQRREMRGLRRARRRARDRLPDRGFRRGRVEGDRRASGVDVILDMVGGDYILRNLKMPRPGGAPGADRLPEGRARPRSTCCRS